MAASSSFFFIFIFNLKKEKKKKIRIPIHTNKLGLVGGVGNSEVLRGDFEELAQMCVLVIVVAKVTFVFQLVNLQMKKKKKTFSPLIVGKGARALAVDAHG